MSSRLPSPCDLQQWKPIRVTLVHVGPTLENIDDIPVQDVREAPYPIILTSLLSPLHHARPSSLHIFPHAQGHHLKEDPVIRVLS